MNIDKKSSSRSGAMSRRALLGKMALGTMAALPLFGHSRSARSQAMDTLSVRVDFVPWGVHAPLHLAQVKGWLKEDGLNVDIQDGAGTLSTINLVASGKVDVGFVQLGPMAIARSNGLPVKSFAGYMRNGDLAVLVDAEKGPKTAKELAGKKIVCFANSPWAPFIDQYIKNIGLEKGSGPGQVNVVMVSPAALVSTYASGDADGFMSLKEFGEPLVMGVRPARSFLAVDAGIAFPSYGLIATDESLAKRAAALKRLSANQTRAWTYIFEKPAHLDEAIEAMMSQRADKQLKPEVLKSQLVLSKQFIETSNTAGKPMGWQSADDWKLAVKSMSDAGLLKADAKIEDFYTNDFMS